MKRRISETTPEDPSPIRTLPPQRSLHGVRSSDSRFPNPISRRPKDFSCKKRIKFTDVGADNPVRMLKAPRSDDPKTSEFAFFKKLKGNAGHNLHSHKLHRDDNQSKKFHVSDCSGERTSSVKNSFKDFRSSLVTQNITPINFSLPLSPLIGASKNSEVTPREDSKISRDICSIWENMETYSNALNPGGAQHTQGEIFSRKRQKLRQWVVETSYPHIEELCSKGYDLVSLLLNRLFPEDNENSAFKNSKSGEVDIDTKSQSLASLESDFQLKKLSHIHARKFIELDYGSHLDDSPSCWLNRSQEAVLSNSYSPISDAIACLKYEIREPGYEFGGRTPVICADSDSAYGFPSKRYGSFACNRLKELDELHDPNELFLWQAFKNSKPGEVDIDTKSQSLASLESDVQLKKLSHIPARNFMEVDYGSHLDNSPSSCWLNRSHEAVLSNSYPPISDAIAYLKYEIREPEYEFGGRTPFLRADSDSAYGFPSKRYGSFACNRLELGELHDPNEYLIQREPHALLLGWDYDKGIDKRNLSNTCQSTELSVYSPSSSSWGDDHQHIMDDRFGANEFSKSSFLSIYSPKVIPLPQPQSPSASYSDHDFGRHVIEDKEDICTDVNHFPLALSLTPDYPDLAEDCKNDTKCKDSSILRAPENLHHIMSKVFNKRYHCPGVEGFLFSSALDIELEWKFPSLIGSSREHHSPFNHALQTLRNEGTSSRFLLKDMNESSLDGFSHRETLSHLGEDIINIQDCSSFYFQIPLDKEKACPLLLNQSSWDGT